MPAAATQPRQAFGLAILTAILVVLFAGQAPAQSLPPPGQSLAPKLEAPGTTTGRLGRQTLAPPAVNAPRPPAAPGPSVELALSARYGPELPAINSGLVWRVYAVDADGSSRAVREEKRPTPHFTLPPGNYIVHVAFGLAYAVKPVRLSNTAISQEVDLPAGGIRIEGRVGDVRIPTDQISYEIYHGSQFEPGDKSRVIGNVRTGNVVLLSEGIYHIVSNYGDANSVVRSDIRVQAGKLTDVTVTHRAAAITLKLVAQRGGEAIANTAWAVLNPGGDVIKESIGAFPRVILAEGEYKAIARNEGKVYEREFNVINGVDGEIEVLAR